jgi:hypothetical protein
VIARKIKPAKISDGVKRRHLSLRVDVLSKTYIAINLWLKTKKESFALFLSFCGFDVVDTKEFQDIDDAPNGNDQSYSN